MVNIPTGLNHRAGLDETRERMTTRLGALGAKTELIAGDAAPSWVGVRNGSDDVGDAQDIPVTAVSRRIRSTASGGANVLVSGHLDTVHDPAGAFRELTIKAGGKLATGPGCVDMKGGLVIALHALEVLEELGVASSWSFIMNSDEETGSFHSAGALQREAASGKYSAGLALEPAMANGGLAVTRGGSGQFMIDARGKTAHVGRDFAAGVSATDALCRAVVAVHQCSDSARGVCVNVSPMWSVEPTNVVASHARAWGNVRFPTPEAGDALGVSLDRVNLDGPRDGLPRVRLTRVFNRPAKPMLPATERLAVVARGVSEDLGRPLPFGTTAGVCDGNNLQDAGLPTIDTLGVRGGGLHTPDEWIELDSLVERCQMLAIVIARLCATQN